MAVGGDIWTLLSQARGAENHNYVVAVIVSVILRGSFYGHSMVVDLWENYS
ncbi:MAG: nitrilase-related carbon-nitrogen hydrolase [Phascolarctobacterium faecium]